MQFKIIDDLKRADPKRRMALLLRMRDKNIAHFRKWAPQLADYLASNPPNRWGIRIDRQFLEVYDQATGELCHPPGGLLSYMEQLGHRYHTGWIDKLSMVPLNRGAGPHGTFLEEMRTELMKALPEIPARTAAGVARLPALGQELAYSGPTVFLGVFTGFHIMFYLSRNEARNVFLIEPDIERFTLSCYFLDYELLHQHFGHLLLHVGPELPQNPVDILIDSSPVTGAVWIRLLPAYPDFKFDEIVSRVTLRWASLNQIFVPFDREVRSMGYGMSNLKGAVPMATGSPALSPSSVIAVVGSGPSLSQDLPWLKRNQDRMIIFSATSTVRVLREHGIRIDYQFALDTEIDDVTMRQLKLVEETPMVAYYKLDPAVVAQLPDLLFVAEKYKANPARLLHSLTGTHPTTGNQAASMARWCKPARVLFIGMDLGYRVAMESHVKGAMYDDDGGIGHVMETAGRETEPVLANFPDSQGQILTHAYHNNARISLEAVCASMKEMGIELANVSDGARIEGVPGMRSAEVELAPYPALRDDVAAIRKAFVSERSEIYEPFEIALRERLGQMEKVLVDLFELEEGASLNWKRWSQALDLAWRAVWDKATSGDDIRIEAYARLVFDLLSDWYRVALLTQSPEETRVAYETGLRSLKDILPRLPLPDGVE